MNNIQKIEQLKKELAILESLEEDENIYMTTEEGEQWFTKLFEQYPELPLVELGVLFILNRGCGGESLSGIMAHCTEDAETIKQALNNLIVKKLVITLAEDMKKIGHGRL